MREGQFPSGDESCVDALSGAVSFAGKPTEHDIQLPPQASAIEGGSFITPSDARFWKTVRTAGLEHLVPLPRSEAERQEYRRRFLTPTQMGEVGTFDTIIRAGGFRPAAEAQRYAAATSDRLAGPQTCPFDTETHPQSMQYTDSLDNWFVIRASAPYIEWDLHFVEGHEMLIPFACVSSLKQLSKRARREREEYTHYRTDLLRDNPNAHMQTYLRDPDNRSKSVKHLHEHLFTLNPWRIVKSKEYSYKEGASITFIDIDPATKQPIPGSETEYGRAA